MHIMKLEIFLLQYNHVGPLTAALWCSKDFWKHNTCLYYKDKLTPQAALLQCRVPPAAPREPGTSLLPAGRDPSSTRLHLLKPPRHATSREEGRESTAQETVAERGTNRQFEMLKSEEAASGSLPPAAQDLQPLLLPSQHHCHWHIHPAARTPFPPPWQYAPKPSMALSYPISFRKPQTEGSARPKLKPVQMWNKREKKQSLLLLLDMLQILCLITVAISSAKET